MENRLSLIFVVVLLMTLIFVRTSAFMFHDIENYGTPKENSKTLTGVLRDYLAVDVHHIHIGIILLIVLIPLLTLKFVNELSVTCLGIGTSLILDQIFPLLNFGNYFSLTMSSLSISSHLIVAELVLIFNLTFLKLSD